MNMKSAIGKPRRPLRTSLLFARELSRGDLDSATACFLRDGCLVTPDATAIHGRGGIRPVLAQLVARRIEVEVELSSAIQGGGAALIQERWKVRSGGIDSPRTTQIWAPILVLRETEEDWKLAIAAPWGWDRRGTQ